MSKKEKPRKRSKKLLVAKKMPPLYHTLPGQNFDSAKSEVYDWLTKQEELMNWLLGRLSDIGYITYNSHTGQWTGVDYYEAKIENEVHYESGYF